MSEDRDAIGARGESIVTLLLTRPYGRRQPFFRPVFLDSKFPAIDFFVELVGAGEERTPFFLIQVKATRRGYTRREHRLRVTISAEKMRKLVAYPVPTYILGIDDMTEEGYIVAALPGGPRRFSSLTTAHKLDSGVLQRLYDEVLQFWQANGVVFDASQFA